MIQNKLFRLNTLTLIWIPSACLTLLSVACWADDTPAKPSLKIIPGKVIVPIDKMQRPWGELVHLDLTTRTGKFRRESTDEVVSFIVLPYAELLHHASLGDLNDFRVGERAIFRLHENEKGEWVWLTYIQDEMNMMNGHGEYFFVDEIDLAAGKLTTTWAKGDMTFIREKGVVIETDTNTRFWKGGQLAKLSDIHQMDKLRTKTHGIGKGKVRVAWEVFLDDESLLKFQAEPKLIHSQRILADGAPGYVDEINGTILGLTLFHEGEEQAKRLKQGVRVRIAPAGVDRKPSSDPIEGKVNSVSKNGRQTQVRIGLDASGDRFMPTELARLWIVNE